MARNINAEVLAEGIKKYFCNVCSEPEIGKCKACNIAEILSMIDDAPTIDAEPVKYGTWLPHKITASVKCSNCRRVFPDETPRCPNCGARMTTRECNEP